MQKGLTAVALRIFVLVFILIPFLSLAQKNKTESTDVVRLPWFGSINFGSQMSGIKSEDFIFSNFSPLLNVSIGKWFAPPLAIQIGYKGFYFNTISGDENHAYNYFYGEAIFDMKNLLIKHKKNHIWSINFHVGSGYFYNYSYHKPNICANFGIQNNLNVSKSIQLTLDMSAIVGWDIYQGDEDILPGVTVGLTYLIPKRNRHNIERHP